MINYSKFKNLLLNSSSFILDLLYPPECLACEHPGEYFCPNCLKNITPAKLSCIYCQKTSLWGATHLRCQKPFSLNGVISAADFSDPLISTAIKKLKYKNAKVLVDSISMFTADFLQKNSATYFDKNNFYISFVPADKKQLKKRGFNQAELLSKSISKYLNMKTASPLVKIKNTKDQTKLNKKERFNNMRSAFVVNEKVRDKNFLIIDDVCTTGATLHECAKTLKRNGAKSVWGLTVAKE